MRFGVRFCGFRRSSGFAGRGVLALVCVMALGGGVAAGQVAIAAAGAWGGYTPGSVGIGDPYVPGEGNGGYRVQRYDLDVRFNPATDVLQGTATITARATQNLSGLNFDLFGLTVESVVVAGEQATFSRAPRELEIQLATGIDAGTQFETVVEYRGRPERLNDPDLGLSGWFNTSDGGIVVGEPEAGMFWFPVNEHPSDKARIVVQATVPKGLQAVSNGRPKGEPVTAHGWTTFTWQARDPMASYLATLAVGKWRFDHSRSDAGVPVLNYVDRSLPQKADRALGQAAEMMDFFARTFGPYPFEVSGGIADNYSSWYALENQTRPTYDQRTVGWSGLRATVAHEIAHQWYGDSVAVERWRHIWLNEGFATYAEWMWNAHAGGPSVAEQFDAAYSRPANSNFWDLDISDPGYAHLFDGPIYYRGAMALYALRLDIGKADFDKVLRRWAAKYANGNATTADLLQLSEHISGKSLDALFDEWLVQSGKPADPR